MVLVTAALLTLYSIVLPLISLYIFREIDAPHFYQLKSNYENIIAGLLDPSTTSSSYKASAILDGGKSQLCLVYQIVLNSFHESLIYSIYRKVATNKVVLHYFASFKKQLTPIFDHHIAPLLKSWDKFKLQLMLTMRPYYLSVISYVIPRYQFIKDSYISYYDSALAFVTPHYHCLVNNYIKPVYDQYGSPVVEKLVESYYEFMHPFYLEHEETFAYVGKAVFNIILGFLIYKMFFEKYLTPFLRYILRDIHDVSKGLDNNYKTDVPSEVSGSLIDTVPDSETLSLLSTVRKIDSMRPLDNIVDHEGDFAEIHNSSTTSFDEDSPTRVNVEARPPYSQKSQKGKAEKTKKQKNMNGSFLDKSLAIGVLGNNDNHAHVCTKVQVQVINENGKIEIKEEIEDELAGKGKPNGELKEMEDSTSEEDDEDESKEEQETTDEAIMRKLNSVSDSSSDLDDEKKNRSRLPKVLLELGSPKKYNTGLFYSTSRQSLVTAAIPTTPSPTKPAFGLFYETPKLAMSSSPSHSIVSTSSVLSHLENETSILSIKNSQITSLTPSKPSTLCVNEETVYAYNKDDNKNKILGDLLSITRTSISE